MYRDHQQAAALRAARVDLDGLRDDIDARIHRARQVNAMVWARWAAGAVGAFGAVLLFTCAFIKHVSRPSLALLLIACSVAPFVAGFFAWCVSWLARPVPLAPADPLTELSRRESGSEATHVGQQVAARVANSHRAVLAGYIMMAPLASHMFLWASMYAVFGHPRITVMHSLGSFGEYVELAVQGTFLGHILAAWLGWRAVNALQALRPAALQAIIDAAKAAGVVGVTTIVVLGAHGRNVGLPAFMVGSVVAALATLITGFVLLWIAYALSKAWFTSEQRVLAAAAAAADNTVISQRARYN
ncbi:MAG: hypothetical protein KC503_19880 [Myxococcales bacterium]|nr:hypothetical protein [Myxococcales bacterium]